MCFYQRHLDRSSPPATRRSTRWVNPVSTRFPCRLDFKSTYRLKTSHWRPAKNAITTIWKFTMETTKPRRWLAHFVEPSPQEESYQLATQCTLFSNLITRIQLQGFWRDIQLGNHVSLWKCVKKKHYKLFLMLRLDLKKEKNHSQKTRNWAKNFSVPYLARNFITINWLVVNLGNS